MLQYKVQSFIILYKPIFKFEKKIRLKFAKTNCIVYKNLNNKLIKFFSLYKSYLKKTSQPLSNLSINSVFSNISISKIDQSSKNFNIKPILNNKIIQKLINKKFNSLYFKLCNFIKLFFFLFINF